MLKIGTKRRRTKQEISEEQEEARIKEEAVESKLAKFDKMKEKVKELEGDVESNKAADVILRSMIKDGYVVMDADGNVTVPSAKDAEQQIQH